MIRRYLFCLVKKEQIFHFYPLQGTRVGFAAAAAANAELCVNAYLMLSKALHLEPLFPPPPAPTLTKLMV